MKARTRVAYQSPRECGASFSLSLSPLRSARRVSISRLPRARRANVSNVYIYTHAFERDICKKKNLSLRVRVKGGKRYSGKTGCRTYRDSREREGSRWEDKSKRIVFARKKSYELFCTVYVYARVSGEKKKKEVEVGFI